MDPMNTGIEPLYLTLDELGWPDDEAVTLQAHQASLDADALTIELALSVGQALHSKWVIKCAGVIENRVSLGEVEGVWVDSGHVLLLDHADRRADLYVSGQGADTARVGAGLAVAHQELLGEWRPMSRYLNPAMPLAQLLAFPSGELASGPATLMGRYADALQDLGFQTHTLRYGVPRRWVKNEGWVAGPDVVALILDNVDRRARATPPGSYVICEAFESKRIDP